MAAPRQVGRIDLFQRVGSAHFCADVDRGRSERDIDSQALRPADLLFRLFDGDHMCAGEFGELNCEGSDSTDPEEDHRLTEFDARAINGVKGRAAGIAKYRCVLPGNLAGYCHGLPGGDAEVVGVATGNATDTKYPVQIRADLFSPATAIVAAASMKKVVANHSIADLEITHRFTHLGYHSGRFVAHDKG